MFGLNAIGLLIKYNLKIIFGNKFIYFLLGAIAFFLLLVGLSIEDFTEKKLFSALLFSGLLLIFYPACYGIQNDQDAKTIEILFGISNYRYKVWLVRQVMMLLLALAVVGVLLALVCLLGHLDRPWLYLWHLIFPLMVLSNLGFLFSTLTRSGNATAAILVVIGIALYILREAVASSMWNILINPYPYPVDERALSVWLATLKNHKLLCIGLSLASFMWALISLQNRERYI